MFIRLSSFSIATFFILVTISCSCHSSNNTANIQKVKLRNK